jgi:hypothetical protein
MPREGIPYVYTKHNSQLLCMLVPISNNCDTNPREKYKKDG